MKELDVVRLVQEFNGFPVGTEGTIVHKYDDSMYEIEFFDKSGNTLEVDDPFQKTLRSDVGIQIGGFTDQNVRRELFVGLHQISDTAEHDFFVVSPINL